MIFKRGIWIIILFILAVSCQSGVNRLEVGIECENDPGSVDSLKYALTGLTGITYVAISPDTRHLTLHYNRFQTHSDVIISCIEKHGYTPRLIEKSPVIREDD